MQLKPFEAGRYDDETIVISNPETGKQELFTESEFEIVKFLKQNEKQTLLALLLPNFGVAKKQHIVLCLRVIGKLKRLSIIDPSEISGGRGPGTSQTDTLEMQVLRERIEITALHSLAATLFGLSARALSFLGGSGLVIATIVLAATSFAFFPFDRADAAILAQHPAYGSLFLVAFLAASGAFSLRSLLQGAYLRTLQREVTRPSVVLLFPVLMVDADRRAVNMAGYRARMQMDLVGLAAPFALSLLFTALAYTSLLPASLCFVGFAACVGATLLLACPFLPFDGADLLQVVFFRDELEERVSSKILGVFHRKGGIGRELVFALAASAVWLLAWLDSLRTLWDSLAPMVVEDITLTGGGQQAAAIALVLFLAALVTMPVALFSIHFSRGRASQRRRRLVIGKGEVKDSLTFEERIAALEKIPLFAYLNDQERLALLNEMQPAFYKHGDYLVHQGELGKEFFVLVKGHANAFFTDVKGAAFFLADLREGDAFGEIALIDDVPRTASIVADGGCIVLVLRKEGFDRFAASMGSPDRVKAMVRLTSFFRRHPLFSKLSARDQAQLIDSFGFQTITLGEQVPTGDDTFHVVYSGCLRVDMGDDSADTTLEPDDCFGYSNPMNIRFFAQEGTGLLSVPKTQFHQLIWEKLVLRPELFL